MAFAKRHKTLLIWLAILLAYTGAVIYVSLQPHGRYHTTTSTLVIDFGYPFAIVGVLALVGSIPALMLFVVVAWIWDGIKGNPSMDSVPGAYWRQVHEANNPYVTDYRYTPQPPDPVVHAELVAMREQLEEMREDARIAAHNAAVDRRRGGGDDAPTAEMWPTPAPSV